MGLTSNYIGLRPGTGDEVVELKTGLIGVIVREYTQNFSVERRASPVKWYRYIVDFDGDRKKLSKTKLYKLSNDDIPESETLQEFTVGLPN